MIERNDYNTPKVSIIIPVFNVEKYIEDCLESIINQSYTNIEIILVNDGSTDGSFSICQQYEERDSRVKLISQINSGLSEARNAGLSISSGNLIMFSDSDDCLHRQCIELLYLESRKHNFKNVIASSFVTNYNSLPSLVDIGKIETKSFGREEMLKLILSKDSSFYQRMTFSTVWAKLYPRELIGVRRFEDKVFEDVCFNVPIILDQDDFVLVNCPLYFYRQRRDSILHSNQFGENNYNQFFSFEKVYNMLSFHNISEEIVGLCVIRVYLNMFSLRKKARKSILRKKVKFTCHELHTRFYQRLLDNKSIPYGMKLVVTVFYYIPVLYDIFIWYSAR